MSEKWLVRDTDTGEEWTKNSRAKAQEAVETFGGERDLEIVPPGELDGGLEEQVDEDTEVVDMTQQDPEVVDQPDDATPPEQLSTDPISFLESVNVDFVHTIKGKPAISKQGFRFIQREFEITTESEVVQWVDDPLGCVVWAKAKLPNGYAAEAHGEGYQFEVDVSDNEFVRYADTRAKNRAISDLTSAGALAVSELQQE